MQYAAGDYNTTKNPVSKKGSTIAGSSPLASTKNTAPANSSIVNANLYQTGAAGAGIAATNNKSNKNSAHDAVNSSHHSANYRTGELNSSQGAAAGANVRDINTTAALFNKTVKVVSGTKK